MKNNIVIGILILITIMAGVLVPRVLKAQATDTVTPGSRILNTRLLKPGLRQYLVYYQRPQSPKMLWCWYWLRDIKTATRNGQPVFTIRQHWYGGDTSSYRAYFSVNSAKDFTPVYHQETAKSGLAAYNWDAAGINAADTVADNSKKGFTLQFDRPNFNWNLDVETFEMLPLAAGKTFAINFYDAGLDLPKFVIYKVTGSEALTTLDNKSVDCWKLVTSGNNKGVDYTQTFWISKKEHEFLKEEDVYGGMYRCKVKLPAFMPDVLTHF
ncbi:MAG TPA: hypothetical protein VIM87_12940 [Chitinophaga sp.]|uniref:DUF3108 domain-containing protein n=1 Tax=Chitinophaga sp. TaxID=1869181 RepID=UPI002F92AF06